MSAGKNVYRIRYADPTGRAKSLKVAAPDVWAEARRISRLHGWARIERGGVTIGTFGRSA